MSRRRRFVDGKLHGLVRWQETSCTVTLYPYTKPLHETDLAVGSVVIVMVSCRDEGWKRRQEPRDVEVSTPGKLKLELELGGVSREVVSRLTANAEGPG